MRGVGVEPTSIDCLILSHEHQDHARGAEVFSKKYRVPVACSVGTLAALDLSRVHVAGWQDLPPAGPQRLCG